MFEFKARKMQAVFRTPEGNRVTRQLEIRTDPLTGNTARITYSRSREKEPGIERLHSPPPEDLDTRNCPFCKGSLKKTTPMLTEALGLPDRPALNASVLFPNLFPYTEWSAVSIMDNTHYVEIGTAPVSSYRDSLINCSAYLARVLTHDPDARYMGITQNHLPAAGGSLIHPHFQVHATRHPSNRHRVLGQAAGAHRNRYGTGLVSDLAAAEKENGIRFIGQTGAWYWMAAFAPQGFYEILGAAPGRVSLLCHDVPEFWEDLTSGILAVQKFYRSMNRNSYNLGVLSIEDGTGDPELLVSIRARSSYAPWVRNDITGFEMGFNDMATFTSPESTARDAALFFSRSTTSGNG